MVEVLSCYTARRSPLTAYELPAGNAAASPAWDATSMPVQLPFSTGPVQENSLWFFAFLAIRQTLHRRANGRRHAKAGDAWDADLPDYLSVCRPHAPSPLRGPGRRTAIHLLTGCMAPRQRSNGPHTWRLPGAKVSRAPLAGPSCSTSTQARWPAFTSRAPARARARSAERGVARATPRKWPHSKALLTPFLVRHCPVPRPT